MIERTLFNQDHEYFRSVAHRFLKREVVPHHRRWEEQGYVDREIWKKAGDAGLLCPAIPEPYGSGVADVRFGVVVLEEQARAGATGLGWAIHSEVVAPYILDYGSDDQKSRYLPKMASGDLVAAIAMTESSGGSDLKTIRTSAIKEGDHYVLNGSKTFISNGWHCDLVLVAAKTDAKAGAKGISLFLVEASSNGFKKGERLKKVGFNAQDTSELFFDNVRVPVRNRLGDEGQGFSFMMHHLSWERLMAAIAAIAGAESALETTILYAKERKIFDRDLLSFQNTRFTLAELKSEIQIGRVFVDRCVELSVEGKLDAATASMAKYWCTELHFKVLDACVQLHGGYGYMQEYQIARSWADAGIQRLAGGANELMKELIGRSL